MRKIALHQDAQSSALAIHERMDAQQMRDFDVAWTNALSLENQPWCKRIEHQDCIAMRVLSS